MMKIFEIAARLADTFGITKRIGPLIDDPKIYRSLRSLLMEKGNTVVTPYSQSIWVYACINAIAQNLSRVPFILKKDAGDLEPSIIEQGPLYDLMMKPNPLMTLKTLIEATFVYYCLRGEAFWILDRSNISEIPSGIWCFDPVRFEPVLSRTTGLPEFWKYRGKEEFRFYPHELLHFKMFNPYDDLRGLSPIEASRISIEADFQSSIYNRVFFENGATIGGFISVDGELTDEQFNRLTGQFEERHKGASKAHKIAVVEGGGKFTEAKLTQREMDFIKGKSMTRKEILADFKVNEVVLGIYEDIKCFNPDTEVLTSEGWKFVSEIKKGDVIASLNPSNDKASFEKVSKFYEYDYEGCLYEEDKNLISYSVTPEHKMIGKEWEQKLTRIGHGYSAKKSSKVKKGELEFRKIKDIDKGSFCVPRIAKWEGNIIETYDIGKREFERKTYNNGSKNGLKLTEFPIKEFLRFLGWFISEGCFCGESKYELLLSQKRVDGRKFFEEGMKNFPYKITEYDFGYKVSGKDLYYFLLENAGRYSQDRKIPEDIMNLHPSLLKEMFDSLMMGDGTRVSNGWIFSSVSKRLVDDVSIIAIKLGYAVSVRGGKEGLQYNKEKNSSYKPYWTIKISESKVEPVLNPKKVHYKGKVYCFEVPPYHTVLTRRNGKVMWIGQSYEGIRAAHKAFWEECLMPKIAYFEEVLWVNFFSKIGIRRGKGRVWGEFDLANVGPIQINYSEKVVTAGKMFTMGWPINDINKRLQLGMKEVPWGNEWWVPGGYAPVTAILDGTAPSTAPKLTEPKKPKEPEKVEAPKDTESLQLRVKADTELRNKFKKFLFDQRKRALKIAYSDKDWEEMKDMEEYVKLKKELMPIYRDAIDMGIFFIQQQMMGEFIPLDALSKDISFHVESRATLVAEGFRNLINTALSTINKEKSDDVVADKVREIYNAITSKGNVIAKSEAFSAFTYGRTLAESYVRQELAPFLLGDEGEILIDEQEE